MFQQILDFLKDFGLVGMFIHSFIDAIIFPIPAFFLQVSLSIMNPSQAWWIATVGYIACLLGTPIGYLIGKLLGDGLLNRFMKKKWIDSASALFEKNGEAAILIGSFTPIPFKVFTILSGCLHFSLWRLMLYAALGRAVKFYVVGALFFFYGRAAEGMVNGYLTYVFLGIGALIGVGILVKRKLSKRKKQQLQATHAANGEESAVRQDA